MQRFIYQSRNVEIRRKEKKLLKRNQYIIMPRNINEDRKIPVVEIFS